MNAAQPSQPLSWLVLEQYVLGELSPARRDEVEAQLARSAPDREALSAIEGDRSALPPLPESVRAASPARPSLARPHAAARRRRVLPWTLAAAVPVLAAAASLWLARVDPRTPPARSAVRGGELALRVLSERGGDARDFAPGEALRLRVTCPPALSGSLSVAVFQGGERFAPLPDAPDFACGNGAPWPGAFQVDGREPAHVCVGQSAEIARASSPADLDERAACVTLHARGPR